VAGLSRPWRARSVEGGSGQTLTHARQAGPGRPTPKHLETKGSGVVRGEKKDEVAQGGEELAS